MYLIDSSADIVEIRIERLTKRCWKISILSHIDLNEA
jgi:hypothetical protein